MTNRPLYSLCVYAHLVDLVVICDRTDVTRTAGRAARDMTHRSHRTPRARERCDEHDMRLCLQFFDSADCAVEIPLEYVE